MTDTWRAKAEKWLWDSCGYAPDDSVDELAELMEKAAKWDARTIESLLDVDGDGPLAGKEDPE